MQFKRLSPEDFEKLESEFIDFLVLNGIVAEDWTKIKEDSPETASKFLDSFSDVIYASTLRKMQYVEKILPQEILCFYCQPSQIVLVGVSTTNKAIDFTTLEEDNWWEKYSDDLEVFTQTKSYSKDRESEIFDLLEMGAKPSDGKLFTRICSVL